MHELPSWPAARLYRMGILLKISIIQQKDWKTGGGLLRLLCGHQAAPFHGSCFPRKPRPSTAGRAPCSTAGRTNEETFFPGERDFLPGMWYSHPRCGIEMHTDLTQQTDKLQFALMPPRAMRYGLWVIALHPLGPSTGTALYTVRNAVRRTFGSHGWLRMTVVSVVSTAEQQLRTIHIDLAYLTQ